MLLEVFGDAEFAEAHGEGLGADAGNGAEVQAARLSLT